MRPSPSLSQPSPHAGNDGGGGGGGGGGGAGGGGGGGGGGDEQSSPGRQGYCGTESLGEVATTVGGPVSPAQAAPATAKTASATTNMQLKRAM